MWILINEIEKMETSRQEFGYYDVGVQTHLWFCEEEDHLLLHKNFT